MMMKECGQEIYRAPQPLSRPGAKPAYRSRPRHRAADSGAHRQEEPYPAQQLGRHAGAVARRSAERAEARRPCGRLSRSR